MKLVGKIARAQVEERGIVRMDYPPYNVVIVRTERGHFALEDACNHSGASLAEGWVEDDCLICPVHQYAFSLASGALVRPRRGCDAQRTFVIREEGELLAVYDPFQLMILP